MDLMQERFAKLLLGEDMSGTGRGVSSALALSNSITNLAGKGYAEHHSMDLLAIVALLFMMKLGN
jgi:hypothetical protein